MYCLNRALSFTVSKHYNVALHKQAYQQTTYMHFSVPLSADIAVNGVKTVKGPTDCAISVSNQVRPWWIVDLLYLHYISSVVILNRSQGLGRFYNVVTCMS